MSVIFHPSILPFQIKETLVVCLQTQQRHLFVKLSCNSAEQTIADWYSHIREDISNYNTNYLLLKRSEETLQSQIPILIDWHDNPQTSSLTTKSLSNLWLYPWQLGRQTNRDFIIESSRHSFRWVCRKLPNSLIHWLERVVVQRKSLPSEFVLLIQQQFPFHRSNSGSILKLLLPQVFTLFTKRAKTKALQEEIRRQFIPLHISSDTLIRRKGV